MNKFSLIFPMAGKSSRFDYKFKPFIKISDLTFIELAFLYFEKWKKYISTIYFIITKEQELKFNVSEYLNKSFKNFNFKIIILDKETKGPYETISKAIHQEEIKGSIFTCDCDHCINIYPMMDTIFSKEKQFDSDILIPIWNLENEDKKSWSKIYLDNENNILDISEKNLLDISNKYYGIIGCIFFKDTKYFKLDKDYENISEMLKNNIKNLKIQTELIYEAEFFGDPIRLKKTIDNRRNKKSIFCDIDGVLIQHEAKPSYKLENTILLENVLTKLREWKKSSKIILTTARSNKYKYKLEEIFKKLKVPYDDLICGLPSGQRILINDIKPSMPFVMQAISINLDRNIGIKDIHISKKENENVVNIFKGNSFSKTILVEKNNKYFVRKYILKKKGLERHYKKLKRQSFDLQRFNCYYNNICPKILKEFDNDYFYYFDIEYLKNYKTINLCTNHTEIILKLIDILSNNVYNIKKINTNKNWLKEYFDTKINIKKYELLDETIKKLINLDKITINGLEYIGLKKLLEKDYTYLSSKYLSPIHGDLTFENILYNEETKDLKLIDMDGSNFIDAVELDFGKLLQSYISKYEVWANSKNIIKKLDLENRILETSEFINVENADKQIDKILANNVWCNIFHEKDKEIIKKKGYLYLSTHLLRMIPYRYKVSLEQTIYTIREAIVWLNQI